MHLHAYRSHRGLTLTFQPELVLRFESVFSGGGSASMRHILVTQSLQSTCAVCVPGAPAVHALLLLLEVSSSKLASWASSIRLQIPYVHEPAIRTLDLDLTCWVAWGSCQRMPMVVLSQLDTGRCLFAAMAAFHVQGFHSGIDP